MLVLLAGALLSAGCDITQELASQRILPEHKDPDSGISEKGILMNCEDCLDVGHTAEAITCAIDLCDPQVVLSSTYQSLAPFPPADETGVHRGCEHESDTFVATQRFGDGENHLAPRLNNSYAVMSTGRVISPSHNDSCWGDWAASMEISDPYRTEEECQETSCRIYDAMEWRLKLKAPQEAMSFRFTYVFFSSEYDESIGDLTSDRFYVVLEAPSNNNGEPEIINYTRCRDPDVAYDFICKPGDYNCKEGDKYCFITVNSALSECCWYPHDSAFAADPEENPCPEGFGTTDISGTGYECAPNAAVDDSTSGSSTGWLQTAWPVKGGEEFTITFHIHDAGDTLADSAVIIDSFQFLKTPMTGTGVVE